MSQALFDHMSSEHGLTLLESEMDEIERVIRMQGDDRAEYLRKLPPHVVANWLIEAARMADIPSIGMSVSSFGLAMDPVFRATTPLEMFDLCVAVVRERIAAKPPPILP